MHCCCSFIFFFLGCWVIKADWAWSNLSRTSRAEIEIFSNFFQYCPIFHYTCIKNLVFFKCKIFFSVKKFCQHIGFSWSRFDGPKLDKLERDRLNFHLSNPCDVSKKIPICGLFRYWSTVLTPHLNVLVTVGLWPVSQVDQSHLLQNFVFIPNTSKMILILSTLLNCLYQ